VFRIRIGFNADPDTDPDPALKVYANPDSGIGFNADPDTDPDPAFKVNANPDSDPVF
jgi:hypothetical protein